VIRILVRLALAAVGILSINGLGNRFTVIAQEQTGAICVSTFADTNGNGLREETEAVLPGVNVNLSTEGVIISTHVIAAEDAEYCFENLLPGIYTVTFTDSPTYRTTTANEGTFVLDSGQRLTLNPFGAVPVPSAELRAEVAAQVIAAEDSDEPLDASTRLLLATIASMAVMVFMIGIGAVLLGVISSGRRRKKRQRNASSG
jgi:hypothetical protein